MMFSRMMRPKAARFAFLTILVGSAATIAASYGFRAMNAAQQPRKSTDPPVAARGKMGQDLFLAIDHRDLAGVQALIQKGADPNSKNGLEFTPLYIAAASHQPDVMHALINAGAKVDADS